MSVLEETSGPTQERSEGSFLLAGLGTPLPEELLKVVGDREVSTKAEENEQTQSLK